VVSRYLYSCVRTGTFRWVMTTTVSFPLTETAVCPEPEMALNAYSESKVKTVNGIEIQM
jgi:hypothetical protein